MEIEDVLGRHFASQAVDGGPDIDPSLRRGLDGIFVCLSLS